MNMTGTLPPAAPGRPWPERFPGPAPQPHAPGTRLELREGIRAMGFGAVERPAGLSGRRIAPEPEALLLLGAIDPGVQALLLVFLPQPGAEPLELLYEGHPLATEPAEPVTPLHDRPGAWALRATLPLPEALPRPAWGRLEIRRALPPGPVRHPAPALHAVVFL
jgi:hypothetical protein